MSKVEHPKSLIIVAVLVASIAAIRFTSTLWHQPIGRVDPHINIEQNNAREIIERQQQQQIQAFVAVTQGEVFRTEQRIREATALATATSLFAANEILNRRIPASVSALLSGVSNAGLIPPGLQLDANQFQHSESQFAERNDNAYHSLYQCDYTAVLTNDR